MFKKTGCIGLISFFIFPLMCFADSSAIIPPNDNPAPPNAYLIGSGYIPQIKISTDNNTIYYLYFNTNQKTCVPNTKPTIIVGVTMAGTSDLTPVAEFAAFPAGPMINPTFTSLSSAVWGDKGYTVYGTGYYQTYSLEMITPTASQQEYMSLSYTIFCMPLS